MNLNYFLIFLNTRKYFKNSTQFKKSVLCFTNLNVECSLLYLGCRTGEKVMWEGGGGGYNDTV